jgi:hypothetical protein
MELFQMFQRLMKDEPFRAFLSHPKVQELMKDPEFQEIIKTQDRLRLLKHPRFVSLQADPEVAGLLSRLDFQSLFPK